MKNKKKDYQKPQIKVCLIKTNHLLHQSGNAGSIVYGGYGGDIKRNILDDDLEENPLNPESEEFSYSGYNGWGNK